MQEEQLRKDAMRNSMTRNGNRNQLYSVQTPELKSNGDKIHSNSEVKIRSRPTPELSNYKM